MAAKVEVCDDALFENGSTFYSFTDEIVESNLLLAEVLNFVSFCVLTLNGDFDLFLFDCEFF